MIRMYRDSLRRADRVSAILERLATHGSVSATDLAASFGVSAATLRRDLQLLEDQKLLTRTHGGAIAHDLAYELPVRYRTGQQREQKRLIARHAVARLPHGPLTLGLTGGTTTREVARLVADRTDLTVITNALNIAAELALRPQLKLIVTGGVTRTQSYELVGPLAEQTLASFNIEIAVVGVDGISASGGLTTHDEIEAHTNATTIQRANRVVIVADGSKIGRVLLARICSLDDVAGLGELVTDKSADPEALDEIRRAGVAVEVVDA
jgi:DeoR family transcriptional regulator, aga operon transcriptional repressor